MSKFKVGDKVRRIVPSKWPEHYGKLGEVYTVTDVIEGCPVILGDDFTADPNCFELVEQEEKQMEDTQKVKVTGNAFKYGYNVGDFIKFGKHSSWVVAEDGRAYSDERDYGLIFDGPESDYTLVKPAKETSMNSYKTTITTTISLEQGQVESLLIKALGLEGKGVKAEWNQDGSVEISYKDNG